jgi:hypothetical protein
VKQRRPVGARPAAGLAGVAVPLPRLRNAVGASSAQSGSRGRTGGILLRRHARPRADAAGRPLRGCHHQGLGDAASARRRGDGPHRPPFDCPGLRRGVQPARYGVVASALEQADGTAQDAPVSPDPRGRCSRAGPRVHGASFKQAKVGARDAAGGAPAPPGQKAGESGRPGHVSLGDSFYVLGNLGRRRSSACCPSTNWGTLTVAHTSTERKRP